MQFTAQIKMTNSEMRTPDAVAAAVRDQLPRLEDHANAGKFMDVNGNTVGSWEVIGDDEAALDKALVSRSDLEALNVLLEKGLTATASILVDRLLAGIQS